MGRFLGRARWRGQLKSIRLPSLPPPLLGDNNMYGPCQGRYLYDNQLRSVNGVASLQKLTHLYLQNNEISDMTGICDLPHLSKLYLQGNRLSAVCGLQNLPSLEELHLSGQRLAPSSSSDGGLYFDTRSMLEVASTLRVLCAVDCGIGDEAAAALPPLPQLRKLDLSGNCMEIVECLDLVLRSSQRLTSVELRGNPFCKGQVQVGAQRYRDSVILMSTDSVTTLDGEAITAQQRSFLLKFHIAKLKVSASIWGYNLCFLCELVLLRPLRYVLVSDIYALDLVSGNGSQSQDYQRVVPVVPGTVTCFKKNPVPV